MPLFHYTNQAGLCGIIENKSLWFTDVFFLNDATEFDYTFKLVKEELQNRINDSQSRVLASLGEGMSNLVALSTAQALCADYQSRLADLSFYVFSFTSKPDDLSQWRAYSDNGAGYCIEFDYTKMKNICAAKNIIRVKTIYSDSDQRQKIREVIDEAVEGSMTKAVKESIGNLTTYNGTAISEIQSHIFRELFRFAPSFKHPKFADEDELRVYIIRGKAEGIPLRFRSGKAMLIPYLDVDIADDDGQLPITRIIIGPTNHPNLSRKAVTDLLQTYSVKCEIESSDIPYRTNL